MRFTPLLLNGAFIIEPEVFRDDRGAFYRYYCETEFKKIGHSKSWLQFNHSYTKQAGTIRGMHFQFPPYSEIKMVKCIAGKIFDVIVDLRKGSPTFLSWIGVELSAENRKMLYIPEGFAHGFQTLVDDCELVYHHSAFYTQGSEGGIRFDDPRVNIQWPLMPTSLSGRDNSHSLLKADFKGIQFK